MAMELLSEVTASHLGALLEGSGLDHQLAAPVATGGTPVPSDHIEKVQESVRGLAEQHGWPESLSRTSVSGFDQPCSVLLHDLMDIVPADAAHEGVWSFLSLVVLPDVSKWRFPDAARDRMIGAPRNVFRRLWWRAEVLGRDALTGEHALGEDELVQIMERPSLSADYRVAREIANVVMSRAPQAGLARSELMRDLAKRVLRLMPVISLDALEDHELAYEIETCCALSAEQLISVESNMGT
ncbi:MAG: hypothetical protein GEU71_04080 [Actinobacteria bacterium]|nr:hypothetical protein [Actinomycetota bacterium]